MFLGWEISMYRLVPVSAGFLCFFSFLPAASLRARYHRARPPFRSALA